MTLFIEGNVRLSFAPLQLRQATLIIPKTGRRVKRGVTFGPLTGLDGSRDRPSDERSPLLRGPRRQRGLQWRIAEGAISYAKQVWSFAKSKTGRDVLKCSIAYFLGSLATFIPAIAALLGQQDGKHMVATITVYFHPARSKGSMVEAIICAAVAFVYAVFICFSSMAVSIFFGRTLDLIVLGHVIVLITFCGAGLGLVGWTKQRLGHPLVNVSCSLTSLAIITVLTKEGAVQAAEFSDDKVVQVMIMILMGVSATIAVSLLISPVSASDELKKDLVQVTDLLGDLLAMITTGFLTGSEEELQQQHFLDTSTKSKKAFSSMTKNLKESKYEHYVMGTETEYQLEAKLVNCMQRLEQNVGGLRSAATTQFLLMSQTGVTSSATPTSTGYGGNTPRFSSFPTIADGSMSLPVEHGVLAAIHEVPEDESQEDSRLAHPFPDGDSVASTFNSPADIFSRFITQLGPSMVSTQITAVICFQHPF